MKRRAFAVLTLLAALLGMARAEPLCLVTEDLAFLLSEDGEVLLEGVDDVFAVREGELYAAGRRGAYRLYDGNGALLCDTSFAMIDDQGDCLIYRVGSRYGAMDSEGNILLPAEWTQLTCDGAGGWLALDSDPLDESPDAILHVDRSGEAVQTAATTMGGLSRVLCDRMPYMAADGRYGAIDGRGNVVIQPVWRYIGPFVGGLAKAAGDGGMGLVDVDGIALIPPIYGWLERGSGCVAAMDDTGVDVYGADGESLMYSVPGAGLEAALAGDFVAVYEDGRTRLYDLEGKIAFDSESRVDFVAGLDGQVIASDGGWGESCAWLMNPDGSAASGRFQRILPLAAGRYAWLTMQGIEYYSADLDRVQTSWNYESLRYGLMDAAGNALTPAEYLEIRTLGEHRLLMVSEEGVYLADLDGGVIRSWLNPQTEAATGEAGGGSTG